MPKSKRQSHIIFLEKYKELKQHKSFIYIDDIKKTLKFYNQPHKGKKKELLIQLHDYFETFTPIENHQGPCINEREFINNKEDFYTFQPINEIPKEYLFTYKNNDFIYGFDIRSFKKLIDKNCENPYTREKIPQEVIFRTNNRLSQLKKLNININYEEENISPEQEYKNKVLDIFQKIDHLNVIASGTKIEWFLNLSFSKLKYLYRVLEDIWNYRAELTFMQKCQIVPFNNIFKYNINNILNMSFDRKRELENIILDEMNKLISSSHEIIHKSTGCYYILIAFTEVCPDIAKEMPWLIQY